MWLITILWQVHREKSRRLGLTNPQLPPSPERQAADPFAIFPQAALEVLLKSRTSRPTCRTETLRGYSIVLSSCETLAAL